MVLYKKFIRNIFVGVSFSIMLRCGNFKSPKIQDSSQNIQQSVIYNNSITNLSRGGAIDSSSEIDDTIDSSSEIDGAKNSSLETEKLRNNLINKSKNIPSYSINKLVKKVYQIVEPVIFNQKLLKLYSILNEKKLQPEIKSRNTSHEIKSKYFPDYLNAQFVKGFPVHTKRPSLLQKQVAAKVSRLNSYLSGSEDLNNTNKQIIDGPAESKLLDTETVHNKNSSLIKARNSLTPVQDNNLTPEGYFVNPSQLTSNGRYVINKTKDRRVSPLLQSRYEEKNKEFLPVYSIRQLENKNKHTIEALKELGRNITKYNKLPKDKSLKVDLTIVEELLAHPDTELYMNVMGQGREPIVMVLNRGRGNYPFMNHIGTFERRSEISKYNAYISNYLATPKQIKNFDASKSSSITYQDLTGNSHTNIGSVFGKSELTSAPTVNDVDSEL